MNIELSGGALQGSYTHHTCMLGLAGPPSMKRCHGRYDSSRWEAEGGSGDVSELGAADMPGRGRVTVQRIGIGGGGPRTQQRSEIWPRLYTTDSEENFSQRRLRGPLRKFLISYASVKALFTHFGIHVCSA